MAASIGVDRGLTGERIEMRIRGVLGSPCPAQHSTNDDSPSTKAI